MEESAIKLPRRESDYKNFTIAKVKIITHIFENIAHHFLFRSHTETEKKSICKETKKIITK